jgi:hypothetical protein
VGKGIRCKTISNTTINPRQVYTNILHIDEYIRIYYLPYYSPTTHPKVHYGEIFQKSKGPKKERRKRNLDTAKDIHIFPT